VTGAGPIMKTLDKAGANPTYPTSGHINQELHRGAVGSFRVARI